MPDSGFVRSCVHFPLAFTLVLFIPQVSNADHVPADDAQKVFYAGNAQKKWQSYKVDPSSSPVKADEYWGIIARGLGSGLTNGIDASAVHDAISVAADHFEQYHKDTWSQMTPRQKLLAGVKGLVSAGSFLTAKGWGPKVVSLLKTAKDGLEERPPSGSSNDLSRVTIINKIQTNNTQEIVNNYFIVFASEAHDRSKTDAAFAVTFDQTFQNEIGVSIRASTQEMVQGLNLPGFAAMVNSDGSLDVTIAGLKVVYQDHSQRANDTATQSINISKLIHNAQRLSLLTGRPVNEILQSVPIDLKAQAELQYQVSRETIATARAAIGLASTFSSFFDQKTARDIEVFGGSTVRIADAINELSLGAVGLKGGLLAANNIAGSVLAIYGMFSGGPSQDAVMRQQLEILGQKIDQLRVEMHERFDIIDSKLNTIFDTININFNIVIPNLALIIDRLTDLQADLDRFERNFYDLEIAGFVADLDESITGCIAFREIKNFNLPLSEYSACENKFYIWATQNARTLATIPGNRAYDDDNLYKEVSKYVSNPDLDFFIDSANINYFSRYPQQRFGLPPLSNAILPNPSVWAIAAQSHLQLARENPAWDAKLNVSRLKDIQSVGKEIQQALKNVTTGSSAVFGRLLQGTNDGYGHQIDLLRQQINEVQREFIQPGLDETRNRLVNTKMDGCDGRVFNLQPSMRMFNQAGVTRFLGYLELIYADHFYYVGRPNFAPLSACLEVSKGGRFVTNVDVSVLYKGRKVYAERIEVYIQVFPEPTLEYLTNLVVSFWGRRGSPPYDWDVKPFFDDASKVRPEAVYSQNIPLLPCGFNGCDSELVSFIESVQESVRRDAAFQKPRYCHIVGKFNPTDATAHALEIQQIATRMAGKKAAVEKFLLIGLPESLAANDYLRSLIYGSVSLPGRQDGEDDVVTKIYGPRIIAAGSGVAGSIIEACADPTLSADPQEALFGPFDLYGVMLGRLNATYPTINDILTKIDQGQIFEVNHVVESTLTSIEQFIDAKEASTIPTPAGSNISVQTPQGVQVTFPSIFQSGYTITTEVVPGAASGVPGGFVINGASLTTLIAYAVETTAILGPGQITTCFTVSSVNNPTIFAGLSIFHSEVNGFVDRTSSRNFATRRICATTTTLSPFAVAQKVVTTDSLPQIVVSKTLTRDVANNQIIVQVSIKNQAGGMAQNLQLTVGRVNATSGAPLPQILGGLGVNGSISTTLILPGSVGLPGTAAILTLGGTYTGGSFNNTVRIMLP